MVFYYMYYVTTPALLRNQLVELLRTTCTTITERGGVIRSVDNIGIRHMAYMMKRHDMVATVGRYIRLQVDCSPETLKKLNHEAATNESVLRWSFIKQKEGVAAMKPKEKKWERSALKNARRVGESLGLGTEGMSPRDAMSSDVQLYVKSKSPVTKANSQNFWRSVMNNLEVAGALPDNLKASLSRFVGNNNRDVRLKEKMDDVMKLAIYDKAGNIVPTPWWAREAARLYNQHKGAQYKSTVRRPHEIMFPQESDEVLNIMLEADTNLLVEGKELLKTWKSSPLAAKIPSTEDTVLRWAVILDMVSKGEMPIGDAISQFKDLYNSNPFETTASLETLLNGLTERVEARKSESELRYKEATNEVAIHEASLLHHLERTHDEFQKIESDLVQGALPKFKP